MTVRLYLLGGHVLDLELATADTEDLIGRLSELWRSDVEPSGSITVNPGVHVSLRDVVAVKVQEAP